MGFFSALVYIIVSFFTGGILILASLNSLNLASLENLLDIISLYPNLKIATGLIGLLIILICIRTIQNSIAKAQREKTIAFEGNYGQVSVSLSAVEDMIKKLLLDFRELKEIRPQVTASKRGLEVVLKVVLSSHINIPEFTGKIQSLVRSKLQSMLGIEEEINIKVEIRKILYSEPQIKKQETEEGPTVPYRDFRS